MKRGGSFKDSLLDDGVASSSSSSSSLPVTAAGCPGMDNAHNGSPSMDRFSPRQIAHDPAHLAEPFTKWTVILS